MKDIQQSAEINKKAHDDSLQRELAKNNKRTSPKNKNKSEYKNEYMYECEFIIVWMNVNMNEYDFIYYHLRHKHHTLTATFNIVFPLDSIFIYIWLLSSY